MKRNRKFFLFSLIILLFSVNSYAEYVSFSSLAGGLKNLFDPSNYTNDTYTITMNIQSTNPGAYGYMELIPPQTKILVPDGVYKITVTTYSYEGYAATVAYRYSEPVVTTNYSAGLPFTKYIELPDIITKEAFTKQTAGTIGMTIDNFGSTKLNNWLYQSFLATQGHIQQQVVRLYINVPQYRDWYNAVSWDAKGEPIDVYGEPVIECEPSGYDTLFSFKNDVTPQDTSIYKNSNNSSVGSMRYFNPPGARIDIDYYTYANSSCNIFVSKDFLPILEGNPTIYMSGSDSGIIYSGTDPGWVYVYHNCSEGGIHITAYTAQITDTTTFQNWYNSVTWDSSGNPKEKYCANLSLIYKEQPHSTKLSGNFIFGLTKYNYSDETKMEIDTRLGYGGYIDYHLISYEEHKNDLNFIASSYSTYQYLLTQEGLLDVANKKLCENYSLNTWKCGTVIQQKTALYTGLLVATATDESEPIDLPFCQKDCYDNRADVNYFNWNSTQGNKTFQLNMKKGFYIIGVVRPYSNGCIVNGSGIRLCVNGSKITMSFTHPKGDVYEVSGEIQQKYWNSFITGVSPNMVSIQTQSHGIASSDFKYIDLVYLPIDGDNMNFTYSFDTTFTPLPSGDNYEYASLIFSKGGGIAPFCSEEIAQCRYDFSIFYAHKENIDGYDRYMIGGKVSQSINANPSAMSYYYRNGSFETKYNIGDMFVPNGVDSSRIGIFGEWFFHNPLIYRKWGFMQQKKENNVSELFGFNFNSNLTPTYLGVLRNKTDSLPFYQGYESNRKNAFLPADVKEGFYAQNNTIPQTTVDLILNGATDGSYYYTDDGIFRRNSPLCPEGQVELYVSNGANYEGKCFSFVENADCYMGSYDGKDEDRFGNQCYLQIKDPDVCPADGRTYTVVAPPPNDFMCRTETAPQCQNGQIRIGGYCYNTAPTSCPNGQTAIGGECFISTDQICPAGYNGYSMPYGICYYAYNNFYIVETPISVNGSYSCSNPNATYISENKLCGQLVGSACPNGYTYDDSKGKCVINAEPICSGNDVLINGSCYTPADKVCASDYTTINSPQGLCYSFNGVFYQLDFSTPCPSGYTYEDIKSFCAKQNGNACNSPYVFNPSNGQCESFVSANCGAGSVEINGVCYLVSDFMCPNGYDNINISGGLCYSPQGSFYKTTLGPCPAGYSPFNGGVENICYNDLRSACPVGQWDAVLDKCVDTQTASCPNGDILIGDKCYNFSGYTCDAQHTLTYFPGGFCYSPLGSFYNVTMLPCPSGYNTWSSDYACVKHLGSACGTGYTWDSTLKKCVGVTTPSCPSGQVRIGENCYTVSPQSCPSGYSEIYLPDGLCYRTIGSFYDVTTPNSSTKLCPSGFSKITEQYYCYQQLTSSCGAGYTWDEATRKCNKIVSPTCPAGYTLNATTDKCVKSVSPTCPAGYTLDTNTDKCVQKVSPTCPAGHTLDTNTDKCVQKVSPTCTSGYILDTAIDKCVRRVPPTCTSGTYNTYTDKCEWSRTACEDTARGFLAIPNDRCYGLSEGYASGYSRVGAIDLYYYQPSSTIYRFTWDYNPYLNKYHFNDLYYKDNGYACLAGGTLNTYNWYCYYQTNPSCPSFYSLNTSIDKCERLLPPFCSVGTYNIYTNQCESIVNPTCSVGTYNIYTNQCESIVNLTCSSGTYNIYTDQCESIVNPSCSSGTYNTYTNQCESIVNPSCSSGQTNFGGMCYNLNIKGCLSGDYRTSPVAGCYTYSGVSCSSGTYNPSTDKCDVRVNPSCSSGSYHFEGDCFDVKTQSCPIGYTERTTPQKGCYKYTRDICLSGYTFNSTNNTCTYISEESCLAGEFFFDGRCYNLTTQVCPTGYTTITYPNGYDKCYKNNGPSCVPPYTYNPSTGSCVSTVAPSCGQNQIYYDGLCYNWTLPDCPVGYSIIPEISTETCFKQGGTACLPGTDFDPVTNTCYGETNFSCGANEVFFGGFCWNVASLTCPAGYEFKSTPTPGCYHLESTACPDGYTFYPEYNQCLKEMQNACAIIPPYDYIYDPNTDSCVHTTPTLCSSPYYKFIDPDTGWSACYELNLNTPPPHVGSNIKGHIYCQNDEYYWNYGGKEGCYKLEGQACNNQYDYTHLEQVIIGQGNNFGEWTGFCYNKEANLDVCSYNNVPLRATHSLTEYACMKLVQEITSKSTPDAKTFSQNLCDTVSMMKLGKTCNSSGYPYDYSNYQNTSFSYLYGSNDLMCPIGSTKSCTPVAGDMFLCGAEKSCAGCTDNVPMVSQEEAYASIKEVKEYNGRWFGVTWDKYKYDFATSLATKLKGTLPNTTDELAITNIFPQLSSYWIDGDFSDIEKTVVIVWTNQTDVGFLGECVFDENYNMLCTADMLECSNNVCPYGSQYPCQNYQGKSYCSKYSNKCKSMADPNNGYIVDNDTEGQNDKTNDGEIDDKGNCLGTLYIFSGNDMRCRKAGVETGGSDCCKKDTTWFGIGKCSEKEKMLSSLRKWGELDGNCHYVGTYCSSQILGVCIQKKRTYCCFSSPLARIIQEQGRPQLGKDFGSAKDPDCDGFTPDEFQKIDWDKVDLSEYIQLEVKGEIVPNISDKLENSLKNMQLPTP